MFSQVTADVIRRIKAIEAERDALRAKADALRDAIAEVERAVAFLDQCRASPEQASEAGCFKDAREWLETAARAAIDAARAGGGA